MAIEASYVGKIEEIKAVESTLNDWERGFIMGGDDSRPIWERDDLSDKQKNTVDRIYRERVQEMSREESSLIEFGNPRVKAIQGESASTYRVILDETPVGPDNIKYGEAVNTVAWLTTALNNADIVLELPPAGDFPGA